MNNSHIWLGASGKNHENDIKPIDFEFDKNQFGNFIFCRETSKGWKVIYVGEGDLKIRTKFRINESSVIKKGATHIHFRLIENEDNRNEEKRDILACQSTKYDLEGYNLEIEKLVLSVKKRIVEQVE